MGNLALYYLSMCPAVEGSLLISEAGRKMKNNWMSTAEAVGSLTENILASVMLHALFTSQPAYVASEGHRCLIEVDK